MNERHLRSVTMPGAIHEFDAWTRITTGHGDTVVTAVAINPADDTLLIGVMTGQDLDNAPSQHDRSAVRRRQVRCWRVPNADVRFGGPRRDARDLNSDGWADVGGRLTNEQDVTKLHMQQIERIGQATGRDHEA